LYCVASSCARLTTWRPSGSSPATACGRVHMSARARLAAHAHSSKARARDEQRMWGRAGAACVMHDGRRQRLSTDAHTAATESALDRATHTTHHARVVVDVVDALVAALHQQLAHHQLLDSLRVFRGGGGGREGARRWRARTRPSHTPARRHGTPAPPTATHQHDAVFALYPHGRAGS
jgi:hypothetical protein